MLPRDGIIGHITYADGRVTPGRGCTGQLHVGGEVTTAETYRAAILTADAAVLPPGGRLILAAGRNITLQPGFEVRAGGYLRAEQATCYAPVGDWQFEYFLTDHLGNTRVVFADIDGDGSVNPTEEVLQESHYYAFGLEMESDWSTQNQPTGGKENRYRYNGIERNEELGLYDYGARWYDPTIARWTSIDPLAGQYRKFSPYAYTANNPIRYIDPDGMRIDVDTKEKDDGTTQVKIKYTGVLQTDGVDLSRKELRQIRRQIKKQLKSSFTVNSNGVRSKIKVKLRIGGTAAADDNRIVLANAGNSNLKGSNGQAPDGFDAFVNAEMGADAVVKTAVHEVGHNMGLPHNVSDV